MSRQLIMRWGNSLAFRIPASIARTLGIGERTPVRIEVKGVSIVITPTESLPEFSDADFARALRVLEDARTRRKRTEAADLGPAVGGEIL